MEGNGNGRIVGGNGNERIHEGNNMSGSMEGKGNGRIHGGEKVWTDPRRGKGKDGSTEGIS